VGHTILPDKVFGELDHIGRDIESGDVSGSALGELGHKPPRAATDVANALIPHLARFAHHPFEPTVNVGPEHAIHPPGESALALTGVDGIELGGDVVPETRYDGHVVLFHSCTLSSVVSSGHVESRKLENPPISNNAFRRLRIFDKLV